MTQTRKEKTKQVKKAKAQSLVEIKYNGKTGGVRCVRVGLVLGTYSYYVSSDMSELLVHPLFYTDSRLIFCRVGKYTEPVVGRSEERYTVSEALKKTTESAKQSPADAARSVFNWERLSACHEPEIEVHTTDVRREP